MHRRGGRGRVRGTYNHRHLFQFYRSERRKLLLGVKYVCTGVELKMQLRMTLCCSLSWEKRHIVEEE